MERKGHKVKTHGSYHGDDVILSCPEVSDRSRLFEHDMSRDFAPTSLSKRFSKSHSQLDVLMTGDASVTSVYGDDQRVVSGVQRPVALEEELQSHVSQLYSMLSCLRKRSQVSSTACCLVSGNAVRSVLQHAVLSQETQSGQSYQYMLACQETSLLINIDRFFFFF